MSTISVSTQVAAPLEQVFATYTDIGKAAERISSIVALEVFSDGPFGEGTRWRETRVMFKKQSTEEMWVTGVDSPNRDTVEAESNGMKYSTLFTFTPENGGTKVTWVMSCTALSFGAKIMAPIFNVLLGGTMRKCMLGDLEALRDVCEASAD